MRFFTCYKRSLQAPTTAHLNLLKLASIIKKDRTTKTKDENHHTFNPTLCRTRSSSSTLEKLEKAYAEKMVIDGLETAFKETKINDLVACYQDLRPTYIIVSSIFALCQSIYWKRAIAMR